MGGGGETGSDAPRSGDAGAGGLTGELHGPGARWRARVRRTRGGTVLLKAVALVIGVAFIALGLVLIVLPGPLTIPPMLVGLYVLSLEFAWAERLLDRARESADEAWQAAKRKPVSSAVVTVGGLLLAGVAIWATGHYDLVGRGRARRPVSRRRAGAAGGPRRACGSVAAGPGRIAQLVRAHASHA